MLLQLVDALRCPEPHEPSALVLSVTAWSGQRVVSGLLGCPMCHARYPIRGGVAEFTGRAAAGGVRHHSSAAPTDDTKAAAVRLAAQLALAEPGGLVLLTGRYADLHAALQDLVDVTCILVDARLEASSTAAKFQVHNDLPLNDAVLRGAAIDLERCSPQFLGEVRRCMASGARLVASTSAPRPGGLRRVAEDDLEWVAQSDGLPSMVALRRAGDSDQTPNRGFGV